MASLKSIFGMFAIAMAALFTGSAVQAETVLRLNNWLPPGHSQLVNVMEPWAKKVEEATEGRVKVQITDASLGAPPRQYDLAVDGVADITFGVHGYTPGRFKLSAIAELPFIGEKAEPLSVALWRTYEKHFKDANEYKDVVLLSLWTHASGRILTSEAAGAVTSLESYQGKKIRVGGGVAQKINSALGGVDVSAPANEVYEMLSQGVVDGALLPIEAYPSFKLTGVIKYATRIPGGFYTSPWFAVMNRAAFERLSPEDQKALMSVSGEELAKLGGRAFDQGDDKAEAIMKTDGVEMLTASDEFVAGIKSKIGFLEDEWSKDAATLGVDAKAALETMRQEAQAYKPAD